MSILENLRTNLPADLPDWPLEQALARYSSNHHGDFDKWLNALENLPDLHNRERDLTSAVTVKGDVDRQALADGLQLFHPWRKGPFSIGEVFIDTEWRSDFKWQRLKDTLGNLSGQRVLDIGCGNGYFGWRMLGQGAREVIGIDPTLLFCMQHLAIEKYVAQPGNWVLPLGIEEIPNTTQFDRVLSMGVIYHRRDPQAHIEQLAALTRPGGHSIVESIVVEGSESLIPPGRYARMRNVWCVPSTDDLCQWLQQAGFTDIRVLDVSRTTTEEQRPTQWMRFESLADTLDPENPQRTIEGHPAPVRAIVVGKKPSA